ncbi:MAG: hypothetical protein PHG48_08585, partial [Eubacteriales bacterium]|nr:hypothetical protein [Eubacteriales bacterium]
MRPDKYITIKKYQGNEVCWKTDIELNGLRRKKVMLPDAEEIVLSVNKVKTSLGKQKIDIDRYEIEISATTDISQVSAGLT